MADYNEKIGGGAFHHVTIKVRDFGKTVKMYNALGFKEFAAWGEGDKRGTLLDIGDGKYLEIFAGGSKENKKEGPITHFGLRTENCVKAVDIAIKAGFEVIMEPTEITVQSKDPMYLTIAFVKGPDGEEIEFVQER